jgi:4-amino-4-deoxy-L-arabinose transferase-like glycosyltransferase
MEKNAPWKRRTGGAISVLYLLIFVLFEVYSASATALDRNPAFPSWEQLLGWALFVLPCGLLVSLFLLHGRRSKLGFSLVVGNLCLYASFMIFELTASHGIPESHRAMWEVEGIWAMLFLAAFLAARFLRTKAQTMDYHVPGKSWFR